MRADAGTAGGLCRHTAIRRSSRESHSGSGSRHTTSVPEDGFNDFPEHERNDRRERLLLSGLVTTYFARP